MSFRNLEVVALAFLLAVPNAGCATRGRVRIVESCNPDPETQSLLCVDPEGMSYDIPYSVLNREDQLWKYACTKSSDFQFLLEEYRKK